MTAVVVALPEPHGTAWGHALEREGIRILAILSDASQALPWLQDADALLLPATRRVLTPELRNACDRAIVRLVPFGASEPHQLRRLGLPPALPLDTDPRYVAALLGSETAPQEQPAAADVHRAQVIAIWGPQGAPGRTTTAIQLAVELRRSGRRCALLDADTVAPSISLSLGLDEDSPGLAAACRRAELGGVDTAELTRLSTALDTSAGDIEVLGGLNRPGRWPELSSARLRMILDACRAWADFTVVDVAAAFDADEEITDDLLSGPRRNAATATVLAEADTVIAVTSADPVSLARFVRDHAELRRLIGSRVHIDVVVNRTRSGPLGIDPRRQVRRSLERFSGISDVFFLPFDARAADAALLHARPMADVTPRSSFVAGVRKLAARLVPPASTGDRTRESSRASRRLRRGHAAPAG